MPQHPTHGCDVTVNTVSGGHSSLGHLVHDGLLSVHSHSHQARCCAFPYFEDYSPQGSHWAFLCMPGLLLMDAIFLPASHSSGLSVILLVREFREDEEEECRARSCSHDISSARVWGQLPQPSILKKECLQPPSC